MLPCDALLFVQPHGEKLLPNDARDACDSRTAVIGSCRVVYRRARPGCRDRQNFYSEFICLSCNRAYACSTSSFFSAFVTFANLARTPAPLRDAAWSRPENPYWLEKPVKSVFVHGAKAAVLLCCVALLGGRAVAQGPAPETAPPLFPGGALISYNSIFTTRGLMPGVSGISPTARPTFAHEGDFNFTWGFHPDFDLTILVPVVTNQFEMTSAQKVGGTGLGDAMALVKYRFYRRDSPRGTTQASFTVGPKFPTGQTSLTDHTGTLLPATLQPGSGSTDLFLAANWTYTGLFNFRRLVANEEFHSFLRSQGTQRTRMGNDIESRFWLSYRPYESKNLAREWFIGPVVTWMHSGDDRIAGISQSESGGDELLAGITSYAGLRPGMHVWLGVDWDVAHTAGKQFMPLRRHISFGITQQFRFHL
jgi:hypothetical protein